MISMRETPQVVHYLHGLVIIDIRKWWKFYSPERGQHRQARVRLPKTAHV